MKKKKVGGKNFKFGYMEPKRAVFIIVLVIFGLAIASFMGPAFGNLMIASLGGGDLPPAPGAQSAGGQNLIAWDNASIDAAGNVGSENSIFSPDANTAFIAYRDDTKTQLKFARTTNGGKTWIVSVIDSQGDVGNDPSVFAADANTVYVTYRDATDKTLDLAKSIDGGANWTLGTIDDGGAAGDVGTFSSIFGTDANHLFVSYRDVDHQALKFAKTVNGGQSWITITVDNTVNVGPVMSLDTPDGQNIFIGYRDQTNGNVKLAKSVDTGENWSLSTVGSTLNPNLGNKYASIDAVDQNLIFMTYRDAVAQTLNFAKSIDGGANWAFSVIDQTGNVGSYDSLQAIDANRIYVGYHDIGNKTVKFARSSDGGATWQMQVVDASGAVGYGTSLSAPTGKTIFMSYHDQTNFDLKYAKGTANVLTPGR